MASGQRRLGAILARMVCNWVMLISHLLTRGQTAMETGKPRQKMPVSGCEASSSWMKLGLLVDDRGESESGSPKRELTSEGQRSSGCAGGDGISITGTITRRSSRSARFAHL